MHQKLLIYLLLGRQPRCTGFLRQSRRGSRRVSPRPRRRSSRRSCSGKRSGAPLYNRCVCHPLELLYSSYGRRFFLESIKYTRGYPQFLHFESIGACTMVEMISRSRVPHDVVGKYSRTLLDLEAIQNQGYSMVFQSTGTGFSLQVLATLRGVLKFGP